MNDEKTEGQTEKRKQGFLLTLLEKLIDLLSKTQSKKKVRKEKKPPKDIYPMW